MTPEQAEATVLDRIRSFAESHGTDADELIDHYESWRETVTENADQNTDNVYENGANGMPKGVWDQARMDAIEVIVDDYYETVGGNVPNEYDALLMGGLPGAG